MRENWQPNWCNTDLFRFSFLQMVYNSTTRVFGQVRSASMFFFFFFFVFLGCGGSKEERCEGRASLLFSGEEKHVS